MSKHSLLPPSSAARRIACPGSRALEAKYPSTESVKSREGDAAHWVAGEMLVRDNIVSGETAPNGEVITQEMIDGAKLYFSDIYNYVDSPLLLNIERLVRINYIHPECYGTPDCYAVINGILYIWDYKFGHNYVEVQENWQLIEYAAGILDELEIKDLDTQIMFTIVQPRSFHPKGPIRRWKTRINELQFYWERLKEAENESLSIAAQCSPNPECKYCSARNVCAALQQSALSAVELARDNTALELSNEQLGNELRLLEHAARLLDARITGLSEQALAVLQRGESIPHYMLERTQPRVRWTKPVDDILNIGKLFNIDLQKPAELITPNQALDKGLPKELVQNYSDRPAGSPKLAPFDARKLKGLFNNE